MRKPWVKLHQLGGQNLGDSIINRGRADEAFVQTEDNFLVLEQIDPSEL